LRTWCGSSDTSAAIGTPLRRRTVLVSNVRPQTLAAATHPSNSAAVMRIIVCAIFLMRRRSWLSSARSSKA
jgi:hypothetical protein